MYLFKDFKCDGINPHKWMKCQPNIKTRALLLYDCSNNLAHFFFAKTKLHSNKQLQKNFSFLKQMFYDVFCVKTFFFHQENFMTVLFYYTIHLCGTYSTGGTKVLIHILNFYPS